MLQHVGQGHHRAALLAYPGAVLPTSRAPGVTRLRTEVSGALRDAVIRSGSADSLIAVLALPESEHDVDAWMAGLRGLPSRSSQRDRIVRHLERLDRELA